MRREEVVHDHKVDLATARKFDSVEAVESGKKGVGIVFDMMVVLLENGEEEFMLRVADSFNDKSVVPGKIKKRARFARGPEFR